MLKRFQLQISTDLAAKAKGGKYKFYVERRQTPQFKIKDMRDKYNILVVSKNF